MAEATRDSTNVTLASMCTEITRTLLQMKVSFKFNLKLPNGFNFYISSDCEPTNTQNEKKKKKSPCVIKRDMRRKQEYLERKLESSSKDHSIPGHKCNLCDCICTDKTSLKKHMKKKHKSQVDVNSKEVEVENTDKSDKCGEKFVDMEEYQCVQCDNVFQNESDLGKHME